MTLIVSILATLLLSAGMSAAQEYPPIRLNLEERMTLIEAAQQRERDFEQQQRDYNAQFDHHVNSRLDDFAKEQQSQNEKIQTMQSHLETLYTVGQLGAWAFSIGISVFFIYNGRRYRESQGEHNKLLADVEKLQQADEEMDRRIVLWSGQKWKGRDED